MDKDEFTAQEKIECNFLINLTSSPDQDVFSGTLTVQAARPVFNSSYKSPIVNFQDQDITFKYVEYSRLNLMKAGWLATIRSRQTSRR